VDGDTIIVQPGTYPTGERIPVEVSVTIKGAGGSYPSIGGFWLYAPSRVEGFTITKGVDFDRAGTACTVRNNRFEGCGVSMGSNYLYGNQIVMNNLFIGSPSGVNTFDSWNNTVVGNTFLNCEKGIAFTWGGGGHVVTGNTFQNCDVGIYLIDDSATIYNNRFYCDTNLQIDSDYVYCTLSTAKTAGENIMGGPYLGGNFWGSPAGDGFSETHLDTNGDGFAEEPYQIDARNIDYLPLAASEEEPEEEVTPEDEGEEEEEPEDNSTADVTPDNNSTDVVPDSGNETDSADEVDDSSSSGGRSHKSSGGSSGGVGGGGGSPEPAKNVEVKELSQVFITNGKAVKFEFKNNATCVVSVGFDAIKNVGKTTTIVEQLKSKSVLVPELPAGEVYKSFNVWVGNSGYATSKNIENPGLVFKVEKAWVQEKQIEQDSISLNRYVDEDEHDGKAGSWTELQSSPAGEDDKFLYFSAATPGYGSFVISGKSSMKAPEEVSLELSAENRSVGSLNSEESKTGRAEKSNETGTALISIGIVIGALGVVGLVLRSMKK